MEYRPTSGLHWDWIEVAPPPLSGLDRVPPPTTPEDRAAERVPATWQAVHLLRSRRRTFLFIIKYIPWFLFLFVHRLENNIVIFV